MADDVRVSRVGSTRKNFVRFFKEVRSELKKVIWPSRAQLINNTFTVLMSCLIVGAIIWITDAGLAELIDLLLTGK